MIAAASSCGGLRSLETLAAAEGRDDDAGGGGRRGAHTLASPGYEAQLSWRYVRSLWPALIRTSNIVGAPRVAKGSDTPRTIGDVGTIDGNDACSGVIAGGLTGGGCALADATDDRRWNARTESRSIASNDDDGEGATVSTSVVDAACRIAETARDAMFATVCRHGIARRSGSNIFLHPCHDLWTARVITADANVNTKQLRRARRFLAIARRLAHRADTSLFGALLHK